MKTKSIRKKLEKRIKGYDDIDKTGKTGGGFKCPGSLNRNK